MAEKATYNVLSRVNHNGKDYEVGKPIVLSEDEAKPLLDTKPPAIEVPASAKGK